MAGLLKPATLGTKGCSRAGRGSVRAEGLTTAASPEGMLAEAQGPSQSTRNPSKQSSPARAHHTPAYCRHHHLPPTQEYVVLCCSLIDSRQSTNPLQLQKPSGGAKQPHLSRR